MDKEIKAEFNKLGFSFDDDEDEVLRKCLTFCINYKLTPSDLVSGWEAHYMNRQLNDTIVRNAEMDGFLLHLENQMKEAILKEERNLNVYSIKDFDEITRNGYEDILGTPPKRSNDHLSETIDSVNRTNESYSKRPSDLVTPFGQRKNKFSVMSAGSDLPSEENIKKEHKEDNSEDDIIMRVKPSMRCSLLVHGSHPDPGCRFMHDRIEDRFNFLENRIVKHATNFANSSKYDEPVDPTVASQKSVFAVGMICCDGEGRMNEKSIMLQSSVEHSGGQRVRVDLQKLNQFSVFPGQVLGIEGSNPSGHCFIASKIVDSVPITVSREITLHPAKKQAMDQQFQLTESAEVSMIIAAGPFTTNDNLLFEPLAELLSYASRKLPQLLILLGPFIDSEHTQIKKCAIDQSFDELFRLEILRRLQDRVEFIGPDARVILVPSIRDANHDFVFPQPVFDMQSSDLKHQITSVTNPSIFEANEVKIGCCTLDVLKHISGEIVTRKPADGSLWDGRSRLAHHILGQLSFYPLYPPAESVPLDLTLAREALDISPIPNILVLPSDLAPFVKVVTLEENVNCEDEAKKCICVNPGRLAKGEKGGSFVELNFNGKPETSTASIINI